MASPINARIVVKLLLVALNTVCNQISFTPPNPPITSITEKDSDSGDGKARVVSPGVGRWMPFTIKATIHLFNLIEIYALLTSLYPRYALPLQIHRILVPTTYPYIFKLPLSLFIGSFLIYAATYLRVTCYRLLGRHFIYEFAILRNHELVTTGPYAYVRHPSYTGIIMFMWGMAFTQMSQGSWWVECELGNTAFGKVMAALWYSVLMGSIAMAVIRSRKEDGMMQKAFRDEWDAWKEKTPYSIIPFYH